MQQAQAFDIYNDLARRTNGDIYIGVVGPVRSGKSTFVTRVMDKLILPSIGNKNVKKRAVDELPQSAEGKTIMTTQPKFVPNEAVRINLGENMQVNARLIDCVGYLVEGAMGHEEGDKARLVKTPWSAEHMPFEKAAEIGTQKVVSEHSTIAVVVTTDGSIAGIPRKNYLAAEQRVVGELTQIGKPFVVLLNSKEPTSKECKALAAEMAQKYGVTVLPTDVQNMSLEQIQDVLHHILREFPVKKMVLNIPGWMQMLPPDHKYVSGLIEKIKQGAGSVVRMKDAKLMLEHFAENDDMNMPEVEALRLGDGTVSYRVTAKSRLFYEALSEFAEATVGDEMALMRFVRDCADAKREWDLVKDAIASVKTVGYGVVPPQESDMVLEDPEIIRAGSRYGVRLKASAPSLHIMRVDVNTEVSPMVGSEQQSQYLLSQFKNNPKGIWQTDMFGKSLASVAKEGLSNKVFNMPQDALEKLRKTVGRIVNEGRGSLICILM